jgi:hypothetical protein
VDGTPGDGVPGPQCPRSDPSHDAGLGIETDLNVHVERVLEAGLGGSSDIGSEFDRGHMGS